MIHQPLNQRRNSRGFTLIEILLAIVILGMVLSAVYAAYSGTMKIVQELEYENNVYKMARVTMDRIIRDLSSVSPIGGAFELTSDKQSMNNREWGSLYFRSASHLAFSENEIDGGVALIGYYVQEDQGGESFSLIRSDLTGTQATKEKSKNSGYIICHNIDSLIFTFYDVNGKEYDSWDTAANTDVQKGKSPTAIEVQLSLVNVNDKEKPFKFMTKIFLPAKL
jgi:prepilin-type N-terminal cleavage/methylation domain-containing protein